MAAELIHSALPTLDEPVVEYLDQYIRDAGEDPDVLVMEDVVRPVLESAVVADADGAPSRKALPGLFERLAALVAESMERAGASNTRLTRLDKVVDMSATELSRTSVYDATDGGIDLALGKAARKTTTVDVKRLERQEAKTRAKIAKRAQRDLYESSKLVELSLIHI